MFCPNCGEPVSQTAKFCRACGYDLKEKASEYVQPKTSTLAEKCYMHPQLDAIWVCPECGNGFCILCKSVVEDKLYCPYCFQKSHKTNDSCEKTEEVLSGPPPAGKCANHPEEDVIGICAKCGQEICNSCLSTATNKLKESQNVIVAAMLAVSDRYYCPRCIEALLYIEISKSPNLNGNPVTTVNNRNKREVPNRSPANVVREIPRSVYWSICENCGRQAQTRSVAFYQNRAMWFVRESTSIKGELCKKCANHYFWDYTVTTFICGWLSPSSLFINPCIILNNIVRYLITLNLHPPE